MDTVLKLNGPEPSSLEPLCAASTGLGPEVDLVGLNRFRFPASTGLRGGGNVSTKGDNREMFCS